MLLLIAGMSGIASYKACREGDAHDQSGLCVIDFDAPPPMLGFEYWGEVGIAFGVFGSGVVVAAAILAARDDR